MSMKKKTGSKLAHGVRKVKSQRKQDALGGRPHHESSSSSVGDSTSANTDLGAEEPLAVPQEEMTEVHRSEPHTTRASADTQRGAPAREQTKRAPSAPEKVQTPKTQKPKKQTNKLHPRRVWPD